MQKNQYNFEILYTCSVTSAEIIQPITAVESFNGLHTLGYTNNEVQCLKFYNNAVNYFPRGLPAIFPNLIYLNIGMCGLKEIRREDLIGLEKLKCLILSGNSLTTLPDNLLVGMKSLEIVDFSCNQIEFMSPKIFMANDLGLLKRVNLLENKFINAWFSANTMERLAVSEQSLLRGRSVESMQKLLGLVEQHCKSPEENEIGKFDDTMLRAIEMNELQALEIKRTFNN